MNFPIAALLLACSTATVAQGLDGAVDTAQAMHRGLAERNATTLSAGERCKRAVREHRIAAGAMAQYRCILAGGPDANPTALSAPAGIESAARPSPTQPTATASLGPAAPRFGR